MMELCAITDGISHDLDHALAVLAEAGLRHCELQDLWGTRIDNLTDQQVAKVAHLLDTYKVSVACLSPKLFVDFRASTIRATDIAFVAEMDRLRRCVDIAHKLGSPSIRSMSMQREAILHSANGPLSGTTVRSGTALSIFSKRLCGRLKWPVLHWLWRQAFRASSTLRRWGAG